MSAARPVQTALMFDTDPEGQLGYWEAMTRTDLEIIYSRTTDRQDAAEIMAELDRRDDEGITR